MKSLFQLASRETRVRVGYSAGGTVVMITDKLKRLADHLLSELSMPRMTHLGLYYQDLQHISCRAGAGLSRGAPGAMRESDEQERTGSAGATGA